MQIRGRSAAILLLLFVHLVTRSVAVDVKIAGNLRRSLPSSIDPEKVVLDKVIVARNGSNKQIVGCAVARNPLDANNQILTLLAKKNNFQGKFNSQSSPDQQTDQTQTVIFDVHDLRDLENLERALSIVEYDPQRIKGRKTKRRIIGPTNDFIDSSGKTGEDAESATSDAGKIYYDVPRNVQARKNFHDAATVTPKFYLRPVQRNPGSSESDEVSVASVTKKKSKLEPIRNVEYVYPVTAPGRIERSRFVKNRPQIVQQASSPASEEAGLDANSKTTHFSRYAPSEARKPKLTTQPITVTPSAEEPAKLRKRKRNRKNTGSDKKSSEEEYLQVSDSDPRNVRVSKAATSRGSPEGKKKSRRSGLLATYDVAPRPFAVAKTHPVNSEEASFEKLKEDEAASASRADKNLYIALKRKPGGNLNSSYPLPYSKIDTTRSPVIPIRSAYEKRGSKEVESSGELNAASGSAEQGKVDYRFQKSEKPLEVVKEASIGYSVHQNSAESGSSEDTSLKRPLHFASVLTSTSSVPRASSPGLEIYTNGKTVNLSPQVTNPSIASTVGPYSLSSLFPQHYESTKPPQGKEDEGEKVAESVEHLSVKDAEASDEVAEASDLEGKQSRKSNVNHGGYDDGGGGHDGGGDHKFERGGGEERAQEHHEADGEKGEKGYKSYHEHDKASKGHHDKEKHSNYYNEKDGKEKELKEEGGYHEEHQEGAKGEKQAEFGEKGQHQKGHSIKGQHSVHKKDEFEKKTEFFDEFHDDGDIEKDGEYYQEYKTTKGGHQKSSHHEEKDHDEKYGKKGSHEKGRQYHENKGHKIAEGQDSHYDRGEANGKKGSHDEGKKWAYENRDDGGAAGKSGDHKSDH